MESADLYYEALRTRDPRFDGKFFVGVKTTGIYCRPICPARPKRENVEFFPHRLAAEKAGYRPCLRCRPEAAPLSPAWVGKTAVVRRAVAALQDQHLAHWDEETFAESFGVTGAHLRRLFREELGKTPRELLVQNRLNLARKLLVESPLSVTAIAFAAGYQSIRRFNDEFKGRFKKAPREFRRKKRGSHGGLHLTLPYRPPFDYEGLLNTYARHRVGHLELIENGRYTRFLQYGNQNGTVGVSNEAEKNQLNLQVHFPDLTVLPEILARVRNLFDLDSDPFWITEKFEKIPALKKLLKKTPGIRLPSGWDPFEVAVGTLLGQGVSVQRGRDLVALGKAVLNSRGIHQSVGGSACFKVFTPL